MTIDLKFTKRQQLIDALQARRPWAEEHDRRMAEQHEAAELDAVEEYVRKCQEVVTVRAIMSPEGVLAAIKDSEDSLGEDRIDIKLPTCPRSAVTMLDEYLAMLASTHQEAFTIKNDSRYGTKNIYWLLTHDDDPAPFTVCQEGA